MGQEFARRHGPLGAKPQYGQGDRESQLDGSRHVAPAQERHEGDKCCHARQDKGEGQHDRLDHWVTSAACQSMRTVKWIASCNTHGNVSTSTTPTATRRGTNDSVCS